MKIFDGTLAVLSRALDVRLERQNVLAGDIANADTPGYKPLDIDVAGAMASATGPAPLAAGPSAPPTPDGNEVDIDRTMVELAENGISYGGDARAAGKKLAILRYVASDGNA